MWLIIHFRRNPDWKLHLTFNTNYNYRALPRNLPHRYLRIVPAIHLFIIPFDIFIDKQKETILRYIILYYSQRKVFNQMCYEIHYKNTLILLDIYYIYIYIHNLYPFTFNIKFYINVKSGQKLFTGYNIIQCVITWNFLNNETTANGFASKDRNWFQVTPFTFPLLTINSFFKKRDFFKVGSLLTTTTPWLIKENC